jgi:ATP-binding cassette subfamily F protein 3
VFSFPEPEALSPPIVNLDAAAVGYGGPPVLSRLSLRIDQDDRIALLGRNGEGKSTLSKLLAGKLQPAEGRVTVSSKLRIGYFAQHQVDELHVDETPLQHLRRERPEEAPPKLRARLAGFGLMAEQAETVVAKLSGGQKARLSLLLATLDAPHILILDEPTNHLDIESREALVEALTAYTGAVILVSHDMHLLSLVADRLWLVKDGRVAPYEGDLESYRALLLRVRKSRQSLRNPEKKPLTHDQIKELSSEVRNARRGSPRSRRCATSWPRSWPTRSFTKTERAGELGTWQKKYAEVMDGLDRAEALWVAAAEKLEQAEAG